MAASAEAASMRWRSKLRRLHRLSAWSTACRDGSKATRRGAAAQGRRRIPVAGRRKEGAVLPASRAPAPRKARRRRALKGKAAEKAAAPKPAKRAVVAEEAAAPKKAKRADAVEEAAAPKKAKRADAVEEAAAASKLEKRAKLAAAAAQEAEEAAAAPKPEKRAKRAAAAQEAEEATEPAPAAAPRAGPRSTGRMTFALAMTAEELKQRKGRKQKPPPPPPPPSEGAAPTPRPPSCPPPESPAPPRAKADPAVEIPRILSAESPEELLDVDPKLGEEAVTKAWKRLVLLLHPDKLHGLDEETRQAGQEALNFVHMAREELKRQTQEQCAEVPADPVPASQPRLLEGASGSRKYEVSWRLPETQDPQRPVERYEIWGPRYFSEAGDPYDPVLLATLPPLQSHFVLVEEAPTQQDVMWAADRVLRPTLPLTVHANNGKGSSGPLTFELPWSSVFPWLQGTSSVLCPQCLRLNPRRTNWTRCGGCGYNVPPEASIVVRCPECHGEALWNKAGMLTCSCCLLRLGQAHDQPQVWKQQQKPSRGPPPPGFNGGGHGNGGRGGGRSW